MARLPAAVLATALAGWLLASGTARADDALPRDFVHLRLIDPTIAQDIRYAGADNFTGAPVPGYDAAECVLVASAARSLARVQQSLGAIGLGLKVYDCYRPARAVAHFVAWASATPEAPRSSRRFHPRIADRRGLLDGYIARRSRHSLGIAVDVTLIERGAPAAAAFDTEAGYGDCDGPAALRSPDNGLDMGTGFDCFDAASHTASTAMGTAQREHRRRLVEAMRDEGWRNYSREWWHFEFAGDAGISLEARDVPVAPLP